MRIIIDDVYVERGATAAVASAAAAGLARSTPHAVLEGSLERGEGATEESGDAAEMTDFFGFSEGNHLARGQAVGVEGDGFSGVASFLPTLKQQQQLAAGRGTVLQQQHHHEHLLRQQRSPAGLSGNTPAGGAFYVQQPPHGKLNPTLAVLPPLGAEVFSRTAVLLVYHPCLVDPPCLLAGRSQKWASRSRVQ